MTNPWWMVNGFKAGAHPFCAWESYETIRFVMRERTPDLCDVRRFKIVTEVFHYFNFYSVWSYLFNVFVYCNLPLLIVIFSCRVWIRRPEEVVSNLRGNEGLLFDEMVPVVFVGDLMKGSSFRFNRYVSHHWHRGIVFSWLVISGVANMGFEEIERAAAPLTSTPPCVIISLDKPDSELARYPCHFNCFENKLN